MQWPDGAASAASTALREQLQGLTPGYAESLASGAESRRDIALGYAWHLPTAIWIVFLLLLGAAEVGGRSPRENLL